MKSVSILMVMMGKTRKIRLAFNANGTSVESKIENFYNLEGNWSPGLNCKSRSVLGTSNCKSTSIYQYCARLKTSLQV